MTSPTRCYPDELASIPELAVVVLIGAAGSGKSELAQCLATRWGHHCVLSLDVCRAEIAGDPADQEATPEAVQLLHQLLRHRCRVGLSTVVDATNVNAGHRAPLVELAAAAHLPAVAVVLNTPLQVCLDRQRDRLGPLPGRRWGRRVPDDVVIAQHAAATSSIPALPGEGFTSVYVISRRGRDN
jgi:predicted kinase